jgi:hypothetical protein
LAKFTKQKFIEELKKKKDEGTNSKEEMIDFLIGSIEHNNLKELFQSRYDKYKNDIMHAAENYSYYITKENVSIEPNNIIGFNHGSYNSNSTPYKMLCGAKRITHALNWLIDNPDYYFNEPIKVGSIGYDCYSDRKNPNYKYYLVTSGAHRSTLGIILDLIFRHENVVKINSVYVSEHFVNYSLTDELDRLKEMADNNSNYRLSVERDSFSKTVANDFYLFQPVNYICLDKTTEGFERSTLFEWESGKFNIDGNTNELISEIAKKEKQLANSIDNFLATTYTKRKKKSLCNKIFTYLAQLCK